MAQIVAGVRDVELAGAFMNSQTIWRSLVTLEHTPAGAFGDERVAVRQPLRSADVRAEELSASGIRPDEGQRHRIDLEHARVRSRVDPGATRRDAACLP